MKIIIGSKNPTKIKAVQNVFQNMEVIAHDAPSGVASQPFSDEETMQGAVNRAKQCASKITNGIGIGLEGGVMYVGETLYLCNWGALVTTDGQVFTASGARISLPKKIEQQLRSGLELGVIMDSYTDRDAVRKNEGAIGIFTNNLISRSEMFEHVVKQLRGQWEYWQLS